MQPQDWRTARDYDLGIYLSEEDWTSFEVGVLSKADATDEEFQNPEVRRAFIDGVEQSTKDVAREIGALVEQTANRLSALRANESLKSEPIFPFLPGPDRAVRFDIVGLRERRLSERFDVREPLDGRHETLNEIVGVVRIVPVDRFTGFPDPEKISNLQYGLPIALIILEEVAFQPGSHFSWKKIKIEIITVVLAGMALVTSITGPPPVVADGLRHSWDNHVAAAHILKAERENHTARTPVVDFPFDHVYDESARMFNYKEPGISKATVHKRVSYEQTVLAAYYQVPLDNDGVFGPNTQRLQKQFAIDHNVPNDITNPILRKYLAAVVVPFK